MAIWERHGVRILWRAAVEGATKAASPDVGPRVDVTLIVQGSAPRPAVSPLVWDLGWVTFRDGVPDPELHVSVESVRRVADGVRMIGHAVELLPSSIYRMIVARIVARAAPHELGHYLLGSAAHSKRGLMRARYVPWEAGSRERGLVELDAAQVRVLQQHVAAAGPK